jgi:hypothetical protein
MGARVGGGAYLICMFASLCGRFGGKERVFVDMSWYFGGVGGVFEDGAVFEGTGSDVGLDQIRPRGLHSGCGGVWMF